MWWKAQAVTPSVVSILHNSALIIFVDSRYYLAYHPNVPRWIETQFYNYKNVIAWVKSFGFIGDSVEGMTKVLVLIVGITLTSAGVMLIKNRGEIERLLEKEKAPLKAKIIAERLSGASPCRIRFSSFVVNEIGNVTYL